MKDPRRFGLRPLDTTALDPFLRGLLLDDCVVTRALSAHASADVEVSVEEQIDAHLPATRAALLNVRADSRAVRRRVAISIEESASPALFAESFVIPDRLPADFLASLASNPGGIGTTLESLELPIRRELVCLGLSDGVAWHSRRCAGPVVVRLYRVVVGRGPAILINEAFLLEAVAGELRLANVGVAQT